MDGNFLLMLNMKSLSLQLSIFMHQIMKTLELIFFKRMSTYISHNSIDVSNIVLCTAFHFYFLNNKHIHTNNDILGEMCKFYEHLYTSKLVDNNDIDSYLQTLHLENVFTHEEKTYCGSPSIEECTVAVSNLKSNNSPGLDGLTSEFYKTFWSDIKCLFYDALKEIYDNKEMGFSQRLDKTSLKNYRPISLTKLILITKSLLLFLQKSYKIFLIV